MLLSDFPLFWSCFKKHTRGSIRQNEFTVKIGSRPLMGKVPISPTTLKILNTTTYRLWSRHQMSLRPFMISNPLFLPTNTMMMMMMASGFFFFHLDLFCSFIWVVVVYLFRRKWQLFYLENLSVCVFDKYLTLKNSSFDSFHLLSFKVPFLWIFHEEDLIELKNTQIVFFYFDWLIQNVYILHKILYYTILYQTQILWESNLQFPQSIT